MTDEERRRIEAEVQRDADLAHRIAALEKSIAKIEAGLAWGLRAIWGGVAYLLVQFWQFIAHGGVMK